VRKFFTPEIRDQICEHKADAETWLRIHREAHELGLRSNATMLYGHIEKPWHRIDHLIRLRQLQDETGGFQTFIPLAFHPENFPSGSPPETQCADRPQDHSDQPAHAGQLSTYQGLLGYARA
jgi:2-iminoacetate synthase ThiH